MPANSASSAFSAGVISRLSRARREASDAVSSAVMVKVATFSKSSLRDVLFVLSSGAASTKSCSVTPTASTITKRSL